MIKLKVEVNKEEDLAVLKSLLAEMGLKFHVDNTPVIKHDVPKPAKQKRL